MERDAIKEITQILDEFGDSNTKILKTEFPGIIKIETILDLLGLMKKFYRIFLKLLRYEI